METSFFRSIWGEYPENWEMVMSDKINCTTCPICNTTTKWPVSLMYTNANKCIAVWYEPVYDASIDAGNEKHKALAAFGASHILNAPRIRDWQAFKAKILEFEQTPQKVPTQEELKRMEKLMTPILKKTIRNADPKKKSGCLGVMLVCFVISLVSTILIINF
jgi:hypothetical protein